MTSVLADTHAAIWFLADAPLLSTTARSTFLQVIDAGRPVLVSVVSLVELTYLTEKGRLPVEARQRVAEMLRRPDSGFQQVPFDLDMADAMEHIPRQAIPDMPDRMIAATALHLGVPLVTADQRIRLAGVATIW